MHNSGLDRFPVSLLITTPKHLVVLRHYLSARYKLIYEGLTQTETEAIDFKTETEAVNFQTVRKQFDFQKEDERNAGRRFQ